MKSLQMVGRSGISKTARPTNDSGKFLRHRSFTYARRLYVKPFLDTVSRTGRGDLPPSTTVAKPFLTAPGGVLPYPDPFLEVRFEAVDMSPTLTAWCAGYESNKWRAEQLAKHLLRWLPEFALKFSEWRDLDAHNAVDLLAQAAATIYQSEKYQRRGEFGELLLHAMIRQHFHSMPAISKYFYKDANNDTVKGFDAVHVVGTPGDWELWLGEVKFYSDIDLAIRDVVTELAAHTKRDYLRSEFAAITRKIDKEWPEAKALCDLIHANKSLDAVFKQVCIPVLLTYDSQVVSAHKSLTEFYVQEFEVEVRKHHSKFQKASLPTNVSIKLFLFPIEKKAELVRLMDEALKQCQKAL